MTGAEGGEPKDRLRARNVGPPSPLAFLAVLGSISAAVACLSCGEGVVRPLDGTGGLPPLVRLDSEPPGDTCAAGGTLAMTGLDQNANGILDDREVTSQAVICDDSWPDAAEPRYFGSFTIRDEADAAYFTDFISVSGSLSLQAPGLTSVELPRLEVVGGSLGLAYNSSLSSIDGLSGLSTIGGQLWIEQNDSLTDLTGFAALRSIGSGLSVSHNRALAVLATH